MRKLDPIIDEAHYVLEALHAIDLLIPETLPTHDVLYAIMGALWGLIEGRKLQQSDLDRLNAEFARAVDAPPSSTL